MLSAEKWPEFLAAIDAVGGEIRCKYRFRDVDYVYFGIKTRRAFEVPCLCSDGKWRYGDIISDIGEDWFRMEKCIIDDDWWWYAATFAANIGEKFSSFEEMMGALEGLRLYLSNGGWDEKAYLNAVERFSGKTALEVCEIAWKEEEK